MNTGDTYEGKLNKKTNKGIIRGVCVFTGKGGRHKSTSFDDFRSHLLWLVFFRLNSTDFLEPKAKIYAQVKTKFGFHFKQRCASLSPPPGEKSRNQN